MAKATTIPRDLARRYWRALMENAVGLIRDAAALLDHSPSRSRSLLILAQEEIGKAGALYDLSLAAWTGSSGTVTLTARFASMEKTHQPKLVAALSQDEELDSFWGDYSAHYAEFDLDPDEWVALSAERTAEREKTARTANQMKQSGFYVDRDGDEIRAPQDQEAGAVLDELVRTAGVAEMLLLQDHTRQKESADGYESAQDLHWRVMPYAHPEEFAEWAAAAGDDHSAPGDPIA